jgi:hypothetical protein
MKRFVIAVLATLGSTASAYALTEYDGGVCVTSVTNQCVEQGWFVDTCFASRYTPRGLSNNGRVTQFSLFSRTFAVGFDVFDVNPISNKPISITTSKVARGGYTFNMGFRLTSQSPAAPTTSTKEITLVGSFTNWDEIPGCTLNFRGAYTRRNN